MFADLFNIWMALIVALMVGFTKGFKHFQKAFWSQI